MAAYGGGDVTYYSSINKTFTITSLEDLRSEVRLASLGTGLVIRKISADTLRRTSSLRSSDLTEEEKAIRLLLSDSRICGGGSVNSDFVKYVLRETPSYRPDNAVYLALTILPKVRRGEKSAGDSKKPAKKYRQRIKKKGNTTTTTNPSIPLGYHLAGVVTVGPFNFKDSTGDVNFFDDPRLNERARSYGARDIDLVCALPNTPPLTASVLLANAIVNDLYSLEKSELVRVNDGMGHNIVNLPMYTLERSDPSRGVSSIDSTALRLGFEFVGSHSESGVYKPYLRMLLKDPMEMLGVFPSTVFAKSKPIKWTSVDELCKWDQYCPI